MLRVADKDIERNKQQRRAEAARRVANEEPEDMELELDAESMLALNSAGSLFDEDAKKRWGGINTAPSVFEKTALFHTGKKED